MTQFKKTGIYMRLSRDDEKSGESMSIEHQRIILQKYVAEQGGTVIDEYIDDGWSGTNFDRPAVKKMLEDARTGKIDAIVVKDLSRFGRNYIQVGQYIDYIFPAYGIRFIAINDNVDTADRSSTAMDMMPIMNVFNEWHAANTSKKIRAVIEANQRAGKYTNSVYPYGYKAGADENRTALIDEEAAEIVRQIFNLRVEGNSVRTIAKILTDEGIENPATHFTRLDGKKADRQISPCWCAKTVSWILSNQTYIGNTVQHKTTSVSYKNHKIINIPESGQIIKENAHEAIISRELWDKVQAINKSVSRGKKDKSNKVHALSGLLVCPDCGKKLKIKSTRNGQAYFYCRTYIDLGKKYCASHSIAERDIESIVKRDIQSLSNGVVINEEKLRENFIKERAKSGERNRYSDEKQLKAHKIRLAELDKLISSAFEEKVLGSLPESVCTGLCEKYQNERVAVEDDIAKIKKRLSEADKEEEDVDEYIRRIKAYCNCESLSREMCLQLINYITVGEKEINIYYNFSHW